MKNEKNKEFGTIKKKWICASMIIFSRIPFFIIDVDSTPCDTIFMKIGTKDVD
jgi:hypothetical protein